MYDSHYYGGIPDRIPLGTVSFLPTSVAHNLHNNVTTNTENEARSQLSSKAAVTKIFRIIASFKDNSLATPLNFGYVNFPGNSSANGRNSALAVYTRSNPSLTSLKYKTQLHTMLQVGDMNSQSRVGGLKYGIVADVPGYDTSAKASHTLGAYIDSTTASNAVTNDGRIPRPVQVSGVAGAGYDILGTPGDLYSPPAGHENVLQYP